MRHGMAPKPASWLRYWEGPVNRSTDFTMMIVCCGGPERGGPLCGHVERVLNPDIVKPRIGAAAS
jgi:hypothetical protein